MHTLRTLTLLFAGLLSSPLLWAQTEPRLGVNTTTPQHTLDVNGAINIAPDSAYQINGAPVLRTQQLITTFGETAINLYLGPGAGQNNTTGSYNYFSGYQAGQSNTEGDFNHFSGYQTGLNNTTGLFNHFIGYQAGAANTIGFDNYFSGFRAGRSNTTGVNNHFSGINAGSRNTTGIRNYFSGFEAGLSNTTGRRNVYIGFRAGSDGDFTNAIVIGANVNARGDNTVTIGNSGMTSIGGAVGWSQVSDGRFKREVAEDVPGLDFVTRLRPVSYRVDRTALQAFLQGEEAENRKIAQDQPRETGFIAQEVEEVAQALGYAFNGIIQPQSENGHYQLSYATFVVPLVQAVQDQQELIEALQLENSRLEAKLERLEQLESRLQVLENKSLSSPTAAVSQRQP